MEGLKVFLFTLTAVLSLRVRAEVKKLNMAPDAVDDNFSQCRDKMLMAVTEPDGLLQKELSANKQFEELWKKHSGVCNKNISGGTPYHMDALQAYGNSVTNFRKKFNDLVYSKGSNNTTYRDKFPFKSLHFLLTDSLRLLNRTNTCKTVYYGTSNKYTAVTGTEVRFGKFISAKFTLDSETEVVDAEGGGTLFKITSCSVVNVEENTCDSEEIQCLISPTEVFKVKNIRDLTTEDATYKEITLTHSRFLSKLSCSFFHRSVLPHDGSSAPLLSSRILLAVMSHILASLLLTFLI